MIFRFAYIILLEIIGNFSFFKLPISSVVMQNSRFYPNLNYHQNNNMIKNINNKIYNIDKLTNVV